MRISDWSSDVCSSDLEKSPAGNQSAPSACWRAQAAVRSPAAAVASAVSSVLPDQNFSSANFSSRRGPIRGKPSVATVTVMVFNPDDGAARSEEHTSELQSLMRNSYAVFCLKKKKRNNKQQTTISTTHKSQQPTH